MDGTGLILVGGGEHARVVAEASIASGSHRLLGFVDPAPCEETARRLGLRRLGGDDAIDPEARAYGVLGLAGLGTVELRRQVVDRLTSRLVGWAVIVHPRAWVSPTAVLAPGTVVMAGAVVQGGSRVGAHCVVNTGAIVEHDAEIGDFAHLAPGVVLGGGVRIGEGAFVGLGARVRDHVCIGANSVVAMGSAVIRDVGANQRVMGVPAR